MHQMRILFFTKSMASRQSSAHLVPARLHNASKKHQRLREALKWNIGVNMPLIMELDVSTKHMNFQIS
jgi:hypothetical protein